MKITLIFLSFLVVTISVAQPVKTGIDVLRATNFSLLQGKRVGLITNPTAVTNTLETTVDVIARAPGVRLTALYGPEHGVRGDVTAGGHVDTFVDPATGIPVYSLYGKTRKPTQEMVKNVDVLVYDIQDIGARSYTFINTMALAMEAAAEYNKEFIVLDRPNPLTGNRVEGNILDVKFRSFVGQYPIPYVYGMTCGELAEFLNSEGMLKDGKRCALKVVTMEGYKRTMNWEDTGLPWVPTSPHIPNAETALFYSATGILGELNTINIGVGYTMPFQLIGAPWIDAKKFADALNAKHLPGFFFRPLTYTPYYGAMKDRHLGGVQIYLQDRKSANLVAMQLYAIETLSTLYPDSTIFTGSKDRNDMFDKVMGTDGVRVAMEHRTPVSEIVAGWKTGVDKFLVQRKKYLLYK